MPIFRLISFFADHLSGEVGGPYFVTGLITVWLIAGSVRAALDLGPDLVM